ncbi:transcriptional antiterminator [Palleronia sp. LCG004]|uniref:transcriptional antiterminator n=1 Tax=Palleronia sp. LCG004 TaxID=3079304 RepID=UPI0029421CC3|nr:transcriptional antiterminator [Palleronia sp. LCG004]WOI57120.1 transcriptional antiterminator [Palleronia sp. LCG004]
MTSFPLHNFAGRSALVLHRSEEPMRRVAERCDRLGIRATRHSGDLDARALRGIDMVILDIDTGHDGQFPWEPGQAPLPLIGLVGSESPGRLAWALGQKVDAYLPVSALGTLFSALVVAHETFARKGHEREREAEAARQRAGRLDVIRGVLALMQDGVDEALALKKLRAMAMVERISIEDAARRVLSEGDAAEMGRR